MPVHTVIVQERWRSAARLWEHLHAIAEGKVRRYASDMYHDALFIKQIADKFGLNGDDAYRMPELTPTTFARLRNITIYYAVDECGTFIGYHDPADREHDRYQPADLLRMAQARSKEGYVYSIVFTAQQYSNATGAAYLAINITHRPNN